MQSLQNIMASPSRVCDSKGRASLPTLHSAICAKVYGDDTSLLHGAYDAWLTWIRVASVPRPRAPQAAEAMSDTPYILRMMAWSRVHSQLGRMSYTTRARPGSAAPGNTCGTRRRVSRLHK
jgi:hypothetical protein